MPVSRFPLRPGRPLVHRAPAGRWAFTCDCGPWARTGPGYEPTGRVTEYRPAQEFALIAARAHIQVWHKTAAELETERLEAAFRLPAHERTLP